MRHVWRRRWLRWVLIGVVAVLVLPMAAAAVALRVADAGDLDPQARTRGRDAVWLGHAWLDGRRGAVDVAALAARTRGTGVRDLFVHAGPLEDDGRLDARRFPRARWALGELRKAIPGVRIQAWLGQVVGKGHLDLGSAATRARIVASVGPVMDAGFDGVHYDLEPIHDGDRGLLAVLDGARAAVHARHGVVSVAAHDLEPLPGWNIPSNLVSGHDDGWSTDYLRRVADRVDQVAIMSYDTALPLSSLYGGYVRRQTDKALRVVPPGTDLLMGLPAFHTDDLGHWASAETVGAAVRGVRLGLGGDPRQNFGVALYADYAASPGDWGAYRRGWGNSGR